MESQEPPNTEFRILTYNVWKNDFWDNAFEPLIYMILSDDRFNIPDENRRKDLIKKCASCIPSIIKGIALQPILKLAGEKAADDISDTIDSATDWFAGIKRICNEYEAFLQSIDTLKSVISEYIELIGEARKLVVIVDELDRCKPTFAIQTLEIIKHLFDVDGINFVFSLDIQQLSHSIKCVYGEGMDSVGYIMRFFDYICRMPAPDKKSYIVNIVEERPLNLPDSDRTQFVDYFINVSSIFNLSLRDIQTIYINFLVLEKFEFVGISNIELYNNYLLLLSLKYKKPIFFGALSSGHLWKQQDYAEEANRIFPTELKKLLNQNKQMSAMVINYKNRGFPNGAVIKYVKDKMIYFFNPRDNIEWGNVISLSSGLLFNGILTSKDLKGWEEIKHLTICEFIHRKLEIFDFSYTEELID